MDDFGDVKSLKKIENSPIKRYVFDRERHGDLYIVGLVE